ncbi:MAG TPA: sensor histidine kinase, partial [Erwinia persicina]|nr:sensor histidine kinase [Erwinia persicina]
MLLAVFDRAALMLICLFFITRTRHFRQLLQKDEHSRQELIAVTAIFSLFALFSTWTGINVEGSLVNVRTIAIMSGGILFGPWVGIATGVIAGLHRFLIDMDGVTSVPCLITSIVAGVVSGWINLRVVKEKRWSIGIIGGMACESLTMLLIVAWASPTSLGLDIVSEIALPMILGAVSIGLIVLLVQSVEGEKEAIAARQAKLALDIANKTLPLFRQVNSHSLRQVCHIIREDINADAVAMTNNKQILAYVGVGEENYRNGDDGISPTTTAAITEGKIIIKNNDEAHRTPEIHSMIVIPLWEKGEVTGTLKIYYRHAHRITWSLKEMAVGLSQIISTQLEVSRAEQLREMANKAELRALQSKINPHFLFNALNAISSSIRINPDTARQLITNLSRYLRYNLELNDDEIIDIKKELYQIKDYIAIEQARFGDKLTVIYDIEEDVSCSLPSLLIQPLVENAIVHGIHPCRGKGVVTLSIHDLGDRIRIAVRDTGNGISEDVVAR